MLAHSAREQVVEPGVRDEQRRRDRRGRVRPEHAPVDAERGRGDGRREREVETDPGRVPVLARVLGREPEREQDRPRGEQDRGENQKPPDPVLR